jgi:hypothetical protein
MLPEVSKKLFGIFWKLRGIFREQAGQTLLPSNVTERAHGLQRANLLDPKDYDAKLEVMSVCHAMELGMN